MTSIVYDFAILGSGFTASVLAMVLKRLGYRCVMIDSAKHPRFAIGESSTPIADQILLDLAEDFDLPLLGQLARWATAVEILDVTVGCKRGFSYFFHSSGQQQPADRCLLVPASPDVASADSHWMRSEVDHALVQEAVSLGAELHQLTRIDSVERTTAGWKLLCVKDEIQFEVPTHFIVDASGTATNLDRLLGLKRQTRTTLTQSGSVFAHFEKPFDWEGIWKQWHHVSTDFSFPPQLAALHHVVDDGWMWHLGFDDDRVSLGWVIDSQRGQLPSEATKDTWWDQRLQRFPALGELYGDAKRLRSLECVPKMQRWSSESSGDGWLALPAAVGFIDPLHSTGIAHAMTAIQKIVLQLKSEKTLSPIFLQSYSDCMQKEFWLLDQLIAMAYQSLEDPLKWEAATMVYFAGAIEFEEQRNLRRSQLTDPIGLAIPDFLLANDPQWLDRVVRASRLLSRTKPPQEGWLLAMNDVLGPLNKVGLADPRCEGIYHYTVARK